MCESVSLCGFGLSSWCAFGLEVGEARGGRRLKGRVTLLWDEALN